MKNQIIGVIAAALFAFVGVTADVSAQGQGNTNGVTVPIVGTVTGGSFAGQLNIRSFERSGNQVLATGTLTGTLTNTVTGITRTVISQVAIPLDLGATGPLNGVCEILSLALGPLDLDLLGLQVHLNQVVLNIDAQSGPGNLLGNLLCAVAVLLDGSGPVGQLVARLNQILAALG